MTSWRAAGLIRLSCVSLVLEFHSGSIRLHSHIDKCITAGEEVPPTEPLSNGGAALKHPQTRLLQSMTGV